MSQTAFFGKDDDGFPVDPKTLARKSDPETSRESAETLVQSGELGRQMSRTLLVLRGNPGSTARELGGEGIRKRLNDLRKASRARTGERRVCRVSGQRCQTWWPVSHPSPHAPDAETPA